MRRRELICFLGCGLACPSVALAQQSATKVRIGWLHPGSPNGPDFAKNLQAFRDGLEHLGHFEDRDIAIEFGVAEGKLDRLPGLAAGLVEQKVDVIVTVSTPATLAARKATRAIPIVMISVSDPVGRGLVESLARPGGNVTGLSFSVGLDIFSKGMEFLKEVVPGLQIVALLVNPENLSHAAIGSQMEAAALALNLRARVFQARRPEEFSTAFEAIAQAGCGAVCIVADGLFGSGRAQITKLAMTYRLPSVHQSRDEAEAGGLMSYGPDITDMHRRAATYVDAIIKGARTADLPIRQPTRFDLVINLNTARALGLTIPPTLLVRADEVIE